MVKFIGIYLFSIVLSFICAAIESKSIKGYVDWEFIISYSVFMYIPVINSLFVVMYITIFITNWLVNMFINKM
jgi:hypothetical protein